MQQGHRPRGVPIFLLLGLVLIFVLAAGSSSVFGATGPRTAEGSVSSVPSRVPQPAGVQVLTWNGKNQAGAAVPAGRYLITVEARTPEGRSAQALTSVWLQR